MTWDLKEVQPAQVEMLTSKGGKEEMAGEKRKGCDFGYALAANSCEGVTGVDACTVTAFDMTTAFAVPDPS